MRKYRFFFKVLGLGSDVDNMVVGFWLGGYKFCSCVYVRRDGFLDGLCYVECCN